MIEFAATFGKIGTGQPLGKESAGALTGRLTLEFDALGVSLNDLVRLKNAGTLKVVIEPAQLDWIEAQKKGPQA